MLLLISSLGPRPKTNPSADRFQYHVWVILEAIYTLDEVWGRDYSKTSEQRTLWGRAICPL